MPLFTRQNSGFIPDKFDHRDIWEEELLSGNEELNDNIPSEYRVEGLKFEYQGIWPFCSAFAVSSLVEWKLLHEKQIVHAYSQPHLFFQSDGGKNGSTFRGNLETARKNGCISYGVFPMPDDLYDLASFESLRIKALQTPFGEAQKIGGYVRVRDEEYALKRSILTYGPLLVGVAAFGGYWRDLTPRRGKDNHAVLLSGWDKDGWIIFDSLTQKTNFDGYHRIAKNYSFPSAYAVVELQSNWKEAVEEVRKEAVREYDFALNHYGKPRDFQLEVAAAEELKTELSKFNNQSVWEAAGKFWTVLVNARCYADYNISYQKWGIWHSGDLINFLFAWRRDPNNVPFNLNRPRNQQ